MVERRPYPCAFGVLVLVLGLSGTAWAAEPRGGVAGPGPGEDVPGILDQPDAAPDRTPLPPVPVAPVPLTYRNMKNPVAETPDNLNKGRLLFAAHCRVCHGPVAQEDVSGTPFTSVDFSSRAFQAGRTDGELFYRIKTGLPGTAMLAWEGRLSDREIWLLVTYIRLLRSVPPAPGLEE